MEADLPSQHRPVLGSFRRTCTPQHGIRVDDKRKRTGFRQKKSGHQPIAIGVSSRSCTGLELTGLQLLDISRGLSFLHSLEIVHGDLKGVRLGYFLRWSASTGSFSPSPISG